MITMPTKDPLEVLDYSIDWTNALGTDTISSSTWSVQDGGLAVQSSSFSAKQTIVWLTSGVAGTTAVVKNTVTTTGGRVLVQSLQIPVASL